MQHLNGRIKVTRTILATAAGSTPVNGSILDMEGFDGVLFIASVGTLTATAVTGLKAQQDDASGMGGASDLLDTLVSFADDDDGDSVVLDVYRPQKRYVRCVLVRGTANAVIDDVVAIQYGPMKMPVVHDSSTVIGSETHASPAEGTA